MAMSSMPVVGYCIIKIKHFWHRIWHRNKDVHQDGCCEEDDHEPMD